jgi:outer membrane protein insertion porin family
MRRTLVVAAAAALTLPARIGAQEPTGPQPIVIDSIAVEGLRRVARATVIQIMQVPLGEALGFRDVQRAIANLYRTGQFADVRVEQGRSGDRDILRVTVVERPLVTGWTIRGVESVSQRRARGKVALQAGRPYDPAAAARSRAGIDSIYRDEGYYRTQIEIRQVPDTAGMIRVVFDVDEGRRVTVSQVIIEGNEQFTDGELVGAIGTKPEGFWWWRRGEFGQDKLERDVRELLPAFYAEHGYIDFQVEHDTLIVHDQDEGKGTLVLTVREGDRYEVGTFEVVGNRYFSTEQLRRHYPFATRRTGLLGLGQERIGDEPVVFDQARWDEATQEVRTLYMNNGYMYAQIVAPTTRRTTEDGRNVVDLRWQIVERQPAVINKIVIRGNTVTHEDVIRRAILMVPGDVIRQDALIQSYRTISNLNFFEQPLPPPHPEQINQQGDVDVIFEVKERHTGNVNFGASMGQGTGLGGFIGLQEPNLFGRAKQINFNWQFGRYISDFNLSYTDPAIRGSWISGTVSLHRSRLRYTIGNLGQINSRGGSLQIGFPLRGSRFTRVYTSYTLEQSSYESETLTTSPYYCQNCVLSSIGLSLVRDTRIGMPFATDGVLHRFTVSQGGGPLGGSGNFRRATFEGRWYRHLTYLGGDEAFSAPLTVVMGLSAQAGFIWGDAGPHFRQRFAMGGVQYGIPLRGYEEFSITPNGFDPRATGQSASGIGSFGNAYFTSTAELGLRISQAIYLNTFFDAGNVWERAEQFAPYRLFRSVGVGASLITPLGPLGLDYGYGFDRVDLQGNPDAGWKLHFRIGNIF